MEDKVMQVISNLGGVGILVWVVWRDLVNIRACFEALLKTVTEMGEAARQDSDRLARIEARLHKRSPRRRDPRATDEDSDTEGEEG